MKCRIFYNINVEAVVVAMALCLMSLLQFHHHDCKGHACFVLENIAGHQHHHHHHHSHHNDTDSHHKDECGLHFTDICSDEHDVVSVAIDYATADVAIVPVALPGCSVSAGYVDKDTLYDAMWRDASGRRGPPMVV